MKKVWKLKVYVETNYVNNSEKGSIDAFFNCATTAKSFKKVKRAKHR